MNELLLASAPFVPGLVCPLTETSDFMGQVLL